MALCNTSCISAIVLSTLHLYLHTGAFISNLALAWPAAFSFPPLTTSTVSRTSAAVSEDRQVTGSRREPTASSCLEEVPCHVACLLPSCSSGGAACRGSPQHGSLIPEPARGQAGFALDYRRLCMLYSSCGSHTIAAALGFQLQ